MIPAIPKYQLHRELARGGMGVVWSAEDPVLERPVAIKLCHKSSDQRDQFLAEAQAVARLQHPNVVEIYDYGLTETGHPYMVMELLHGETLGECIHRAHRLTPEALLPLLVQIAKALDTAHAAGIVHRDLKPANVFLCRRNGETVAKVLDFGLAVTFTDARSGAPSAGAVGTPAYMSPEQTRGEEPSHRMDLWSFAVLIYEALCGQRPFRGESTPALLRSIHEDPPPSVEEFVTLPGASFDAFFEVALAKRAQRRYGSAADMIQAFAAAMPAADEQVRTKILIVDDEADVALLIEQCFEDEIESGRYEFVFADNGLEALRLLREHKDVDVIVTDLRMPEMDGLTLLGELELAAPAACAIVMSAFGDMGNIRQAMNRGAYDFLTKPVDFGNLDATIDKAAQEVRRRRRALRSVVENEALRMFVNPAVLERLLPSLGSATIRGTEFEVTVLVVRAHTGRRPARDKLEALNETYDAIVPSIDAHDGIVVAFVGERLVAMFEGARGARAAIEVALTLQENCHRTPLGCSFGAARGPVLVGHVGAPSRRRFDYAVFGEAVDLAHELASQAGHNELLLAESLAAELSDSQLCEPYDVSARDLSVTQELRAFVTHRARRGEADRRPAAEPTAATTIGSTLEE